MEAYKFFPCRSDAALRARDLTVVGALDEDRAAGGFVEAVQQSEQRTLSRAARANDGEDFAGLYFEGGVFDQDFVFNRAAQMLGSEDGIGRGRRGHGQVNAALITLSQTVWCECLATDVSVQAPRGSSTS